MQKTTKIGKMNNLYRVDLFLQQKAQQIFKDISILIYGNIPVVINELSLTAIRFRDKIDIYSLISTH